MITTDQRLPVLPVDDHGAPGPGADHPRQHSRRRRPAQLVAARASRPTTWPGLARSEQDGDIRGAGARDYKFVCTIHVTQGQTGTLVVLRAEEVCQQR